MDDHNTMDRKQLPIQVLRKLLKKDVDDETRSPVYAWRTEEGDLIVGIYPRGSACELITQRYRI